MNKALSGGNKSAITKILCTRSFDQRTQIASAYKVNFGKALSEEIKSKISGGVKSLYLALLLPVPVFYCSHLKKANAEKLVESITLAVLTMSIDLDEEMIENEILIEMMCVQTNGEIRRFLATYQQVFNKRLEHDLREDKSGNFKKLLQILCEFSRDESGTTDLKAAATEAAQLQKIFKKSSVDKKTILEMLATRSFQQIKLIGEEYERLTKVPLDKAIKKNISDSLKKALVAIVRFARNPSEYYARRINKALGNHQMDERAISRLIVARSEVDLLDIKDEFKRIFRKTLKSSIAENTKGSLRNALLTLAGEIK